MKKILAFCLALVIFIGAASASAAAGLRPILPAPGASVLIVTDEETGLPVPGAAYGLYRVNPYGGADTLIASAVSGPDGRITVSHTTTGLFYWAAAADVEGYAADDEKHAFTVIGLSLKTTAVSLSRPAGPAPLFTEVEKQYYDVYLDTMTWFLSINPDARFGFIHLDSDDVPELVISYREPERVIKDLDRIVEFIDVYTIVGGKAEYFTSMVTGPLEYIARTGRFRYTHEYAAYGPDRYIYSSTDYKPGSDDNDWSTVGAGPFNSEADGETVKVIGFCDPDPVYHGFSEREISRSEYLEILNRSFPVTAEASEETEIAGAAYTVKYDVLVPIDRLTIRR